LPFALLLGCSALHVISQPIKTNLYSAMRRKRIRGAYWRSGH